MTTPAWDESLETGDPLVDKQHRDIHTLVDYVEVARDRPELLMGVLERLMEHVDCHFTTEEALMVRTGYVGPEATEHVAEHRRLTENARDAVLNFQRGRAHRDATGRRVPARLALESRPRTRPEVH